MCSELYNPIVDIVVSYCCCVIAIMWLSVWFRGITTDLLLHNISLWIIFSTSFGRCFSMNSEYLLISWSVVTGMRLLFVPFSVISISLTQYAKKLLFRIKSAAKLAAAFVNFGNHESRYKGSSSLYSNFYWVSAQNPKSL